MIDANTRVPGGSSFNEPRLARSGTGFARPLKTVTVPLHD
jgi:hypothetical protein